MAKKKRKKKIKDLDAKPKSADVKGGRLTNPLSKEQRGLVNKVLRTGDGIRD